MQDASNIIRVDEWRGKRGNFSFKDDMVSYINLKESSNHAACFKNRHKQPSFRHENKPKVVTSGLKT